MKTAVIVLVATLAMCGEAVRFVLGAIPADNFHFLLLLIVVAGSASVVAFKKSDISIRDETSLRSRCERAKAAVIGK